MIPLTRPKYGDSITSYTLMLHPHTQRSTQLSKRDVLDAHVDALLELAVANLLVQLNTWEREEG
jgi:hypothetical protein